MKTALLFSGQGSQVAGMGKDLYQAYPEFRDFYDSLNLSFDIKEMSFEADESEIKKTIYTQPLLVAFHLGVLRILKAKGVEYDYTAGLSLGEFSALAAADVLSEEDVMDLIEKRAQYMSDCCKENPSGLIAVVGAKTEDVIGVLDQAGIWYGIANLNCPGQVVLGLKDEDMKEARRLLRAEKFRAIPLDVEGAFHTACMDEATKKLELLLPKYDYREGLPVVLNRTGDFIQEDEDYPSLLAQQASNTTYFKKSLQKLIDLGVERFIEIGYNEIFKGFLKRMEGDFEVISLSDLDSLKEV